MLKQSGCKSVVSMSFPLTKTPKMKAESYSAISTMTMRGSLASSTSSISSHSLKANSVKPTRQWYTKIQCLIHLKRSSCTLLKVGEALTNSNSPKFLPKHLHISLNRQKLDLMSKLLGWLILKILRILKVVPRKTLRTPLRNKFKR
jgi:hypothetical protein